MNIHPRITKALGNGICAIGSHLNHRTQLFIKQRRDRVITESLHIDRNTHMTGKGHLRQGRQQTAIRAIMVSENIALLYGGLHHIKEAL